MSIVPTYSRRFYGFDPTTLPNCAIWLDGSDSSTITLNGSNVTQWSDKSGNNRHATRTSGQNSPTYTAGTNYIQFTATSNTPKINETTGWAYFDCTGLSALGGNQGFTLFIVIKRDSNKDTTNGTGTFLTGGNSITTNQRLHVGYYYSTTSPASDRLTMRYYGNDLDNIALTFATGEPIKILRFRHTAANVRSIAINGYIVQSDTPASGFLSTTYPAACIGAREPYNSGNTNPNNGFNGRIYEFIGYNRPLSDNECNQVESYLGWKYRDTAPLLQDSSAGFGSFLPTSISSCALWLDAADMSTLFQDRAGTTSITASGQNVRRWNNKGSSGSFAQDLTGTGNVYPKYQNGGVYIFNQNSNNYNATQFSALQLQANIGASGDYSVIAVVDMANIASANLQTIFSNCRSSAFNETRCPQFGAGDIYEANQTNGLVARSFSAGFPGSGRRIYELYSRNADLNFFLNGSPTSASTNTTLFSPGADGNPLPTIGIGISNATTGTAYDNRLANGTFYELIYYNKYLTNAERTQLMTYLAKKWRLNTITNAFRPANPYLFVPTYFKRFHPLDITGCTLWLDAADAGTVTTSGGLVTAVVDKSPSGRSLTGAAGFSYPNNTFNGTYPSFYVGTRAQAHSLGSSASFTLTQPITTFFVGRKITSTNTFDGYIFDGLNSTNRIAQYGGQYTMFAGTGLSIPLPGLVNTDVIVSSVFNTTSSTLYANGTSRATGTVGTNNTSAGMRIGNSYSANDAWVGHFCELIIYNGVLTIDQIQEVEGYLAWKWGLKSSLPSFPTYTYSGTRYPSSPKFLPTDFSNCVFWVDASDTSSLELTSGNKVLSLFDKSTNNYIFSNSNNYDYNTTTRKFISASGPTTNVIGTNSSVSIATPFTVFWVAQSSNVVGAANTFNMLDGTSLSNRTRIFENTSGNYQTSHLTTTVSANTVGVFSTTFASTGGTSDFWTNGISSTTAAGSTFTAAGITLGCDYLLAASWFGNIAEVVILTNITASQRVQMEGYLAWKWGYVGQLANGHPYKDIIP